MVTNSQSRKWNIELNSVDKFGLTDEVILEKVKQLASVQYFCLSNLEKTKANNILHKHLYLYSPSPIYFNRLKTLFPTAHIEKAYGSSLENRAYCQKSGKWSDEKNKDKLESVQDNSFYEEGKIPETEQQENNPLERQILEDLKNGLSVQDVIEKNPKLWHKKKQLDDIAYMYLLDKYSSECRDDLVVTFITAPSNTGKTTFVYNLMKDVKKVFRMHNYRVKHALFDGYDSLNHSCILIDEFLGSSQIELTDLNIYLDKFPITQAPARFQNKLITAKYIFICSNLDFSKIYEYERIYEPSVYAGFERRVHNIWKFQRDKDSNILKIIKIKHTKDIDIMQDMENIEFIEREDLKNE